MVLTKLSQHIDFAYSIEDLFNMIKKLKHLPGPEYMLSLVRHKGSPWKNILFSTKSNIISYIRSLQLDSKNRVLETQGFDIIDNRLGIYPGDKRNPFKAHVAQGVLDTNAEAFIFRNTSRVTRNTGEMFARSMAREIPWRLINNERDLSIPSLQIPHDARIRIENCLSAESRVVLPTRLLTDDGNMNFGWWEVDFSSGNTLGLMQSGRGESVTSYVLLTYYSVLGISFFGWPWYLECRNRGGSVEECIVYATIKGSIHLASLTLILLGVFPAGGLLFKASMLGFCSIHMGSG
jgi:hypothetical protein